MHSQALVLLLTMLTADGAIISTTVEPTQPTLSPMASSVDNPAGLDLTLGEMHRGDVVAWESFDSGAAMSLGGPHWDGENGDSWLHDWLCPEGDMVQHHPYQSRWPGYYEWRPQHFMQVRVQQHDVQRWGGDPLNLTDNRFLQNINEQYLRELQAANASRKEPTAPLLEAVPAVPRQSIPERPEAPSVGVPGTSWDQPTWSEGEDGTPGVASVRVRALPPTERPSAPSVETSEPEDEVAPFPLPAAPTVDNVFSAPPLTRVGFITEK